MSDFCHTTGIVAGTRRIYISAVSIVRAPDMDSGLGLDWATLDLVDW